MSPTKRRALTLLTLAKTELRSTLALTLVISSLSCLAQPQTTTQPDPQANVASANPASEATTVPAGTSIALVLTHPIQSRYVHRGDDIYAQIVSPVTARNEVVIPPGTLVQGKIDKLGRNGSRGELDLQSMSVIFPDGYVATVTGPVTLQSDEGYALKDPGKGHIVGTFVLPAAGLGLGALIGHAVASSQPNTITNTLPPGCTGPPPGCLTSSLTTPPDRLKSTAIGSMVGLVAGGVVSLALLMNSRNFFLDVGSPVEMILQHPPSLDQDQVADAIRDSKQHPAPTQPIAPRPQFQTPPPNTDPGTCYTPGTPGTPDIDIPGTPAIGDSPGTPPVHIPGIPATPPTPHPCP